MEDKIVKLFDEKGNIEYVKYKHISRIRHNSLGYRIYCINDDDFEQTYTKIIFPNLELITPEQFEKEINNK